MGFYAKTPELSARSKFMAVFTPALILGGIAIEFLSFHSYNLLLPESLISISLLALTGALLGALSMLRPETLQPLVIAVVSALFISRLPLYEFLTTSSGADFWNSVGPATTIMAYYCILLATTSGCCWLIREHLTTIASIGFGSMLLATAVLPVNGNTVVSRYEGDARQLKPLPPIIHVVLDGLIGIDGLPPELPASEQLKVSSKAIYKDFELYERGFSRFSWTQESLSSLLNGQLDAAMVSLGTSEGRAFRLKSNKWFSELKSKGYAIRVYQSAWFDMCSNQALVTSCYTYPLQGINAVQRSNLTTWQRLSVFKAKILSEKITIGLTRTPQLSALPSTEAFQQFYADVGEWQQGVAHVVHLLLPHEGYLYDADCTLRPPGQWHPMYIARGFDRKSASWVRMVNYRYYLEQMACANHLMDALIRRLRDLRIFDQATIIIHGDHGSRIIGLDTNLLAKEDMSNRDVLDLYSTHIAIKEPGNAPATVSKPVSIQRLIAKRFLNLDAPKSDPMSDTILFKNSERLIVWPD